MWMAACPASYEPEMRQSDSRESAAMNPDPAGPGYEILVFNTNQDIVDMLRLALGEEGYRVGAYHIGEFRRGEADVIEVLERDAPRAVIFDVAPPYQANWAFYRLVSASAPGQRT